MDERGRRWTSRVRPLRVAVVGALVLAAASVAGVPSAQAYPQPGATATAACTPAAVTSYVGDPAVQDVACELHFVDAGGHPIGGAPLSYAITGGTRDLVVTGTDPGFTLNATSVTGAAFVQIALPTCAAVGTQTMTVTGTLTDPDRPEVSGTATVVQSCEVSPTTVDLTFCTPPVSNADVDGFDSALCSFTTNAPTDSSIQYDLDPSSAVVSFGSAQPEADGSLIVGVVWPTGVQPVVLDVTVDPAAGPPGSSGPVTLTEGP